MPTTEPNPGSVRVAGTGAIWKAPLGTALPTDSTTAWGTGFVNMGLATDGFTRTPTLKTQKISAWQTLFGVRSFATERGEKFTWESIESNTATVSLAWGGATMTPGTAGIYTLDIPDGQLADFIIGVDWSDGVTSSRFVIPHATLVTLPVVKYVRTDAVRYPFEIEAMSPGGGVKPVIIYGVDSLVSGV